MTSDDFMQLAARINTSAIAGGVALVRRRRPVLARVKDETGYSLQYWMARAPNMMEASLMAGVHYQTVRRYRSRWYEVAAD